MRSGIGVLMAVAAFATRPVAANDHATGRAQNRRVERTLDKP